MRLPSGSGGDAKAEGEDFGDNDLGLVDIGGLPLRREVGQVGGCGI